MQLDILQVLLPMDYWLVGQQVGGHMDIVATFGGLDETTGYALVDVLADNWQIPEVFSGFRYRSVTEPEWEKIGMGSVFTECPKYVFMANLQDAHGEAFGMVVGFMSQRVLPSYPVSHTHGIVLCLTAIAHTLELHAQLAEAEKLMYETQQDAQLDILTLALNRAGWNKKIRLAMKTGAEVAIGFLDLDCLKAINDTRGHSAGDDLLKLTAQTIQSALRSDDCIARLGGDEFAVMLHNETMADANTLKERLQLALSTYDIQASIGVALGSETSSLQNAVQLADARMYEDKRARRRSRIYRSSTPTIIAR